MIVAQFFDDSIANSSFTCLDPRSKICFLTSEINNELNLYKRVQLEQASSSLPSSQPRKSVYSHNSQYFYNTLVLDIVSSRLDEFDFEIKYNFFSIDMSMSTPDSSIQSSLSSVKFSTDLGLNSSKSNEKLLSSSKRNCDFKCVRPLQLVHQKSPESPIYVASNNSMLLTMTVCLDESLVCDGEIHCIFNNVDEINCKILNEILSKN